MTDAVPPDPAPAANSDTPAKGMRLRLTRGGGFVGWLRRAWQRRWFRWSALTGMTGILVLIIGWFVIAADLPDAEQLVEYQAPLPTIVRDTNGVPTHSFARERRVQLDYEEFPPLLVRAFLAAEDRTFFEHGGVDYTGLVGAVVDYVSKLGSGERARGGSTITQQVAKMVLLGDEYSITRKLREMILAYRIEGVLTKQQILSLYLNEIPMGRRSFGVQAAARAYFNKDVADLALHEMAFLATLPKAPETYGRRGNERRALNRRAYVLGEMERAGWITEEQRRAANAMPLGIAPNSGSQFRAVGGYFMEEVRRQLIDRFGENTEDGPNSVYSGGLWVRTSYDDRLQLAAQRALRNGLLRYHGGRAWSGPIATIEIDDQWASRLQSSFISVDYEDWRVAVVISKEGSEAQIGFADGETGRLPSAYAGLATRTGGVAFNALRPGDIILVKPVGGTTYQLRSVPGISGAIIAQNATSGRVMAMQGGFDSNLSPFNRATQAMRQPGSTIKPFVYATALDNGMTPASIIVDGSFCVYQSASLGRHCFRNSGGGAAGPQTMRWGLEQSRNLMTVRAANEAGMENVADTFRRVGIGDYQPYLAFALGAGETTVARMTNAYAMLVNHGRELQPRLIDYVQDRNGRVIFPSRYRACQNCNTRDWNGQAMPRFTPSGRQLIDPMTAYQVVHMLEGVVQRGTARTLNNMGYPIFGKTGTTTGPKDVWFIGGTPNWVAGVYLGFDDPRNLGGGAAGGTMAVPIFREFAREALRGQAPAPFIAPRGVRMVRIERRSGRRVFGSWPSSSNDAGVIWEAFKPETEPRRTIRQDELEAEAQAGERRQNRRPAQQRQERRSETRQPRDNEFLERQGGIY
jgi:penicillin-binding protein 1A